MNVKGNSIRSAHKHFHEPSTCISANANCRSQHLAGVRKAMNDYMRQKYAISSHFYYTKPIESIIGGYRDKAATTYYYDADLLSNEENLQKYYRRKDGRLLVQQLAEYFKFHYEIPRLFMSTLIEIIDYFHDRRRNLIYQKVKEEIGKENIVGDESLSKTKERPSYNPRSYSSVLRDLRPSEKSKPNDSLQYVLNQIQLYNGGSSHSEISFSIADNFQREQQHFYQFMMNQHKNSLEEKTRLVRQANFSKSGPNLNFKTKIVPALIRANNSKDFCSPLKKSLEKLKETNGLKRLIGSGLKDSKKSIKEQPSTTKPRLNPNKSVKEVDEKSAGAISKNQPPGKKVMQDLEDLHVMNSLSNRKTDLFRSLKDSCAITKMKSKSPKTRLWSNNLLSQDRAQVVLKTEPSLANRSRMSMSKITLTKNVYAPEKEKKNSRISSKLTQASKTTPSKLLTSKKSLPDCKELKRKSADKHLTLKTEASTASSAFGSKNNRASFSNLAQTSSPREFVLIRRLKSEDRDHLDKYFSNEKKQSDKIDKLLKDSSVKVSSQLKHHHQKSTTKLSSVAAPSIGTKMSSFRARAKVNSINFN